MPRLSIADLFERTLVVLIALFVVMTVVSIAYVPHLLGPDVTLYTEVGQKVLDGQRPYVDYEENNFPMIHALYVLPALLTRVTGLPPTITFNMCMITLFLLSLAVTWRVLTAYQVERGVLLTLVFGMTLFSWLMFNTFQWGQREHIFTLLYLPWVILRVMRREGKPVGLGLALMVGLMAGIGLAIKPYFALTGLVVEAVGLVTTRRWHIRTPEVAAVFAIAGLHGLYFALNPDVLRALLVLIQRLSAGYGVYISVPWEAQQTMVWVNWGIIIAPFALVALRYRFKVVPKHLLLALGAMGLGSMIGFLLQRKGWTYHAIPFLTSSVLTVLLLGVEAFLGYVRPSNVRRQNLVRMVIITISASLALGMVASQVNKVRLLLNDTPPGSTLLEAAIRVYVQSGDAVMFADTIPNPAYPMLARLNVRNVSRYPMATPFPVSFYQYQGLPATDPVHVVPIYMQEYMDAFQQSIETYAPKLVIIRSDKCGSCSSEFPNLYDYLQVRGVIDSAVLPNYTLYKAVDGFRVYARNDLTPLP